MPLVAVYLLHLTYANALAELRIDYEPLSVIGNCHQGKVRALAY
jgi:hypothetical protein